MKVLCCVIALIFLNPLEPFSQAVVIGSKDGPSVKVNSSSSWQPLYNLDSASAEKTVNETGLIYKQLTASRFLHQATLGFDQGDIDRLTDLNFDKWIDNQVRIKPSYYLPAMDTIFKEVYDWYFKFNTDSADAPTYYSYIYYNYAFWENHLKQKDKLRQRMALALSEIFVISVNSDLGGMGRAVASYYDLFMKHAFGNYKDLLQDVALHPSMGYYLSHLNNPKEIPEENIHPDENFAREIMQLFTIGLYELNPDGSRKLDPAGNPIPTYDQADIKELAKVFTGLSFSGVVPNMYVDTAFFGVNFYLGDFLLPMKMYNEWHEPGTKKLADDYVIPDGQPGMKDIQDAIDHLFNHPNTGPFICKQLIQRLIKSNPSSHYVKRVADVFADDGSGVRGNFEAVLKAILLDPEARDCEWLEDPANGQLREPITRYTHFASATNPEQYYGRYWNASIDYLNNVGQIPLASPTVFNFFLPTYAPLGQIKEMDLVGPEFQIHNSRTSIGYLNMVNFWAVYNYLLYSWTENDPPTSINLDEFKKYAREPETLINKLDMLLTYGNLSDRTRKIIAEAVEELVIGDYREDRVRLALYLISISPDFAIIK